MNKFCRICRVPVASTDIHHVIPREITLNGIKGIDGPVVELCASCHSNCHKQAFNLVAKSPNKKQFFTDKQMEFAAPFVKILVHALEVKSESKDADSSQKLVLTFSALEVEILHLLKKDAGFSNLQKFATSIIRDYMLQHV